MKKTPTKRATRRLAASLAIITALATTGAWAADRNWAGGSGGTEDAPLDIYVAANWSPNGLPTTSDTLIFSVAAPTVFTNGYANAATANVAVGFKVGSGDYTFLGPIRISGDMNIAYDANNRNTIIKKGDWQLGRAVYIGSAASSYTAFTNVLGNIVQTPNNRWFLIASQGTGIVENLAGNWTIAGYFAVAYNTNSRGELYWRGGNLTHTNTSKPFYLGNGETSTTIVEKDSGDWNIANYFVMCSGKNATASFTHKGGTMKVNGSDIRLCDNSGSTTGGAVFEVAGGTVEAKQIKHGAGSAPAEFKFDGGALKALVSGTLFAEHNSLTVNIGTNGGTIDAANMDVEFGEPLLEDTQSAGGGMTFKGGGSVTLKYTNTYTGETKIAVRTKLVVTSAELARLLENGGITVIKPEGVSAKGTFKLLGKSDGSCTAAEYALITKGAGLESAAFDIDGDGDITVTVSHTPQTWAGEAETSATWSGANWDDGVVFDDGNDAVFATDNAIAEVDDDISAYTLTFNDNAMLTGTGTLTAPTITVVEGKAVSIAGPLAGPIEKTGAGTLTLGSSREGTTTTLTEGTLVANAPVGTLVLGTDATKPVTFDYGGQTYATALADIDNDLNVSLANGTFIIQKVVKGALTVATDTTITRSGDIVVGQSTGTGTLTMNGGAVSCSKTTYIADTSGGTGVVMVNDGNLTSPNDFYVGNRGTGTLTINGGTVDVGSSTTEKWVRLGKESGSTGIVNLNGGELKLWHVRKDNGTGSLVFNGGTLVANGVSSRGLIYSNLPVTVNAGDGTIDANGNNVMIGATTMSGVGGMTYQGGGKVTFEVQPTYTGVTTVEVGTTLVVPAAIAGEKLAFTVPSELADGVYTVVSISGDSRFADNVLSGRAEEFVLSDDKKKICYVKGMDKTKPIYVGTDGNLSAAGNWLNGTVPTGGTGDAQIFCATASTLTVGDKFAPAKLIIPADSELVTIGSGTLCVNEVENRQLLAVGSGATVVIGDQLTLAAGESLCDQNNGTMVVSNLLLKAESGDRFVTEHQAASSSGIFKFDAVTNSMTDNWFYLADKSSAASYVFYIGEGGLNFKAASGVASYCLGHNRTGISTTVRPWYSDFTIADSGTGNYSLVLLKDVTFCTDDENGVGRTITIDAKTRARYSPKITVSGKGTLQVNNGNANGDQPTVTVKDTATLAFGADATLGTGVITLGAGTKLVLTQPSGSKEFTPLENALNLPTGENKVATIRIDGTPLKSGDHVIATVGTGATANVALDPDSDALGGRKRVSLAVEDGKLKLNIQPTGLMVIFR